MSFFKKIFRFFAPQKSTDEVTEEIKKILKEDRERVGSVKRKKR
jgi:hypothetical protein|tara:strand:- start:951 stop:1082 length:132 start_codon:yes stop_codon:yes gene_type:complete